jgi:hypothetical protein
MAAWPKIVPSLDRELYPATSPAPADGRAMATYPAVLARGTAPADPATEIFPGDREKETVLVAQARAIDQADLARAIDRADPVTAIDHGVQATTTGRIAPAGPTPFIRGPVGRTSTTARSTTSTTTGIR